jgi:CxxC motif-containing protein (DUF1111 family)
VEAVHDSEFQRIARKQANDGGGKIHGEVIYVSAVELLGLPKSVGRFGWKSQHSSVLEASADALRNELGIPNRIFPLDPAETAPMQLAPREGAPKSLDSLNSMVEFIRNSEPIGPDPERSTNGWSRAGSKIFDQIGCSVCHVRTLKTAPPGTRITGSNIVVSERLGNKGIHPFSDYLLHDIGTGDGIVQNVRPEDYAESTANKFRTAPLWGVRYRSWLMHDGKSITYHQAIMRHGSEASEVVQNYVRLTPIEKEQLRLFLDSL